MKSTMKDWLKILVLLLDEAAVIVLLLLVIRALRIEIQLPFTLTIIVIVGIVVFVTHRAVIPSFHKKKVTGSEGMIGLEGKVVEPLTPVGVIRVKGEYWKAKSIDEDLSVGEEVVILGLNGLTLKVKCKDK